MRYSVSKRGADEADCIRYRGETKEGVRDGNGTYSYPWGGNSFFTYKGDWKDGQKDGTGTMTLSDTSIYVGEFNKGEMTGVGRRTWADGRVYEGQWLNGCLLYTSDAADE